MIDLLAQGDAALTQATLLLVAGFLFGVGALLIAHEIYLRRRGVRVTGTIVGVRAEARGIFFNVYWYTLPNGETMEATSSSGSNLSRGRDTGRRVELLYLPDRPESVSEARSQAEEITAAVLIVLGLIAGGIALTAWPITWLTGVMLIAGLGSIGYGIAAKIIPAHQRQSPQAWRQSMREKRRAQLAAIPVRRIEDILAERERPR